MTVDIWIRDYNPPRCFQKTISGRGKPNELKQIAAISIILSQCPFRNPCD
jgi:hypothetical protein